MPRSRPPTTRTSEHERGAPPLYMYHPPVAGGGWPLRRVAPLLIAATAVALTLCLVFYPKEALEAATAGLKIFITIVFPSLLPFFVLSELMLGLGVVHFIGVL